MFPRGIRWGEEVVVTTGASVCVCVFKYGCSVQYYSRVINVLVIRVLSLEGLPHAVIVTGHTQFTIINFSLYVSLVNFLNLSIIPLFLSFSSLPPLSLLAVWKMLQAMKAEGIRDWERTRLQYPLISSSLLLFHSYTGQ